MGKILLFTGQGKGKTTAALGIALRACGQQQNVTMVQFCKSPRIKTGEYLVQRKLKPYLTIKAFGQPGFIIKKPKELDIKAAQRAWGYVTKLDLRKIDLLILDELNIALYFNLLNLDKVIRWLKKRPKKLSIIITGRKAPKELLKIADLITEMKEIKHYYQKGQRAEKGIDF